MTLLQTCEAVWNLPSKKITWCSRCIPRGRSPYLRQLSAASVWLLYIYGFSWRRVANLLISLDVTLPFYCRANTVVVWGWVICLFVFGKCKNQHGVRFWKAEARLAWILNWFFLAPLPQWSLMGVVSVFFLFLGSKRVIRVVFLKVYPISHLLLIRTNNIYV